MKNKILILGQGYIGKRLKEELKTAATSSAKINSFRDIQRLIDKHKPKVLINAIGHNGLNNVDDCELAPDKTLNANTIVPLILAEAALRNKIKLVHISSGCIYHFDYAKKQKPISENKTPDYFRLYYSRTKIYTEQMLKSLMDQENILIIRIRIPLDNQPSSRNILTKLLGFKNIIDIPNSVTYIPDFVKALKHLIKQDARGIYNVVCKNPLKYSNLLKEYQKYKPEYSFNLIPLKNLNLDRTNLILSTKKLESSGFKMRTTKEVIKECVHNYRKY